MCTSTLKKDQIVFMTSPFVFPVFIWKRCYQWHERTVDDIRFSLTWELLCKCDVRCLWLLLPFPRTNIFYDGHICQMVLVWPGHSWWTFNLLTWHWMLYALFQFRHLKHKMFFVCSYKMSSMRCYASFWTQGMNFSALLLQSTSADTTGKVTLYLSSGS